MTNTRTGGANGVEKLSICENFQRYFTVEFAATAEQKKRVFEIRYRVYCEEFRYEPADQFPQRAESDDFDEKDGRRAKEKEKALMKSLAAF